LLRKVFLFDCPSVKEDLKECKTNFSIGTNPVILEHFFQGMAMWHNLDIIFNGRGGLRRINQHLMNSDGSKGE